MNVDNKKKAKTEGVHVDGTVRCLKYVLHVIYLWRKLWDGALKYYIMAPSWISMSMSMLLKSRKTFLLTLDPLKQVSADLNRANDVLALIQEIVLAQPSYPFLMEISCASLLWYCKHSFPIPPVDVKIRGVKVPCSMFKTLLEYRRFFSFSWLRYICWNSRSLHKSALGWKTLTSKNADRWFSQNPRAWISNLAPGVRLEPLRSCSPEISWRTGSISTSLHTMLRRSASKSLNSLWWTHLACISLRGLLWKYRRIHRWMGYHQPANHSAVWLRRGTPSYLG